jgi:putative SOS response-associated peptidase YedK
MHSRDDLELSLRTQPVLSEELEVNEVSTLVNSPENASPECVRRVRKTKKQIGQLPL